jgi:hypothetical protein
MTRDSNPLIFPIVNDGTVTIAKDGFYRAFDNGSGSFTEYENITMNKPNPEQLAILEKFILDRNAKKVTISDTAISRGLLTITKLAKGDVYPVTGIYHEGFDLGEYQSVRTSVGSFPLSDIMEGNVIPNKPIQSRWSKILGNLMYWPLGPFVLIK